MTYYGPGFFSVGLMVSLTVYNPELPTVVGGLSKFFAF